MNFFLFLKIFTAHIVFFFNQLKENLYFKLYFKSKHALIIWVYNYRKLIKEKTMSQSYQDIDYSEMLTELNFDLQNGYVSEDSELYIIRQKESVYVEKISSEIFPIIDYFYSMPKLSTVVKTMTVLEAKKECFKALDILSGNDVPNKDALTEAVSVLVADLKQYTAGNNKRNDKLCQIVYTLDPEVPMMLYYDDTLAGDSLEIITANNLLSELKSCS